MAIANEKEPWAEGAEEHRGQRLLPHVVDYYAHHEPDRVFAAIFKSDGGDSGFEDITIAMVANAVNHMAWWMKKNLKSSSKRRTLAYIGPSDLRYTVILLAAIKCGWKTFFISSKNPITLNLGLLQQSDVSTLLFSETLRELAKSFQKFDPSISCKQVPALADMFAKSPPYCFESSWQELKDESCLLLHSAGSTGPPKLINYTHAAISCTDNDLNVPVPEGRRPQNAALFMFDPPGRYYSCFPAFHLAGIQAYIWIPCFYPASTVVMGPPYGAPSGSLVDKIMAEQDIRALWVPPIVIEQWLSNPASLKKAETLDFVILGGGLVAKVLGDRLNNLVDVCVPYGSIEMSQVQMLIPRRGDWQYLEPNPAEECDMQEVDEGIYEMVLHNDTKFLGRRTLAHTLPDIKTYHTQDLFVPHPKKSGLWSFHSRTDDIIVLANNEKVWPIPMESIVAEDPLVAGALVVGNGRPEVILLVEPRSSPEVDRMTKKEFIDAIWPRVAYANGTAPNSNGKIRRSRILISQKSLGFFRSPKGSISRLPTESLYSEAITAAFIDGTADEQNEIGVLEDYWTSEAKRFIGTVVRDIRPDVRLQDTDDFFVTGAMDSLSVLELGQKLKLGLSGRMNKETNNIDFWMRTIFDNPTVEDLANATLDAAFSQGEGQSKSQLPYSTDGFVEEMISQLPAPRAKGPAPPLKTEGINVVLLGCHGRLGPFLVKSLLDDERVAGIKCLDRGSSVQEAFQDRIDELALDISAEDPRLQFVSIDLSKPNLALSEKHLDEIYSHADIIIHSIWSVHYALSLASFASEILKSLSTVIEIANRAESRPRVIFTSSIASVHRWGNTISRAVPVPEEVIHCSAAAMSAGYGQSKQVAERYLAAAGAKLQIPISILRIGQITGPMTMAEGGVWKSRDWLNSLAILSKASGLVPINLANISWIPVDQVASVIREISLREKHDDFETGTPNTQLFNVIHPQPSPTSRFSEGLQKCISSPRIVEYSQWLSHFSNLLPNELSKEAEDEKHRVLPFLKTIFDEGELRCVIDKAKAASPTLASMTPIGPDVIERWCLQLFETAETED